MSWLEQVFRHFSVMVLQLKLTSIHFRLYAVVILIVACIGYVLLQRAARKEMLDEQDSN